MPLPSSEKAHITGTLSTKYISANSVAIWSTKGGLVFAEGSWVDSLVYFPLFVQEGKKTPQLRSSESSLVTPV